jgi:hypothetical protein
MFGTLTGPIAFIISIVLMFLQVPGKDIMRFWKVGLVGGLGGAIVLTFTMHNLFSFWSFYRADVILFGVPLFLSAVWMPLVIAYSYLISISRNIYHISLIIAGFALIASAAHWFLLSEDMLVYVRWSVWYTFILSVAIHMVLLYYLYSTNRLEEFQYSDR